MSLSRFEADLIAAGRREAPDAARRERARAALMGAAGLAVASASASASASAHAGAEAAPAAKGLALLKLVALGALAVGAVVGAASLVGARGERARVSAPPAAVTAAPAVARAAMTPASSAPADGPAPAVVDVASLPVASAVSAAPPPPAEDPLSAEAKLLDAARRCLAQRDLACAEGRLVEHDARFPRGALADESSMLAIDVARASGERARAAGLAEALLARAPHGPYAARCRAALAAKAVP